MRRSLLALAMALVVPLPALAAQVTVKPGETLSEIAERHGIAVSRLMQLNGITDPNHVESGQSLTIPGPAGASRPARGTGGTITVAPGETLSEIAERHGMSMSRLMQINGIKDPDLVEAGQQLVLAAKGGSSMGSIAAASPSFSYNPKATEHTVRKGESLSSIARGYGVPMDKLVAINSISNPDLVTAGTRLNLKGTPPAPTPRPSTTPRPAAASKPPIRPTATATATTGAAPKTTAPAKSTATASPTVATRPAAAVTKPRPNAAAPQVAVASSSAGPAEWRIYGPLQVDWAHWQPMGGSMVAPILNDKGESLYLAINCTARKLNATSPQGQWNTWEDPGSESEQKLVSDYCKAPTS